VVLVWGGAGGLGSMAIQIARAKGAIPIAVVSSETKREYCESLGAKGVINRKDFDHWGMLPHWKDEVGYSRWLKGVRNFGRAIWDILGERRNPRIVFEHPGESTIPTSMFVCDTGGMVVICAGTTGYNATVDLRYLWMRQKSLQGSHFANTEQSAGLNQLVIEGLVDPCLSKTFANEELPEAHQLMYENKHPHGNMSILIGAPSLGLGASVPLQKVRASATIEDSAPEEFYIPPHREIAEPRFLQGPEDDPKVGEVMRPDVVTCASHISMREAARMLYEHDVQGMVVTDADGWALGVVSQTDVVLARQGRPDQEMDKITVADVMTPRLLSCRPHTRVSEAVTKMTRMKVHRLVVVEEHGDKVKAVGLMSMRAIVRRMAGVPQPGNEGESGAR
jgi:crotonyl-CoA carboxylase/reductase